MKNMVLAAAAFFAATFALPGNCQKPTEVGYVPAHASEHDLKRVVQSFEDLAQGAVDEALAEIEHGTDCRLRLLQQNPQNHVRAALVFGAHL